MSSARDRLLDWLRDAHAMEEQAETMLSSQAQRIESYPELKQRIEEHLRETQRQAKLIAGCIERLGSSTSAIKTASAKMMAFGQGLSGLFVGDEVIKGSLASYTFEHMEIASYRILIAAAEVAGEPEIKRTCQEILAEEERMAAWLEEHLAQTTRDYLARETLEGAGTAKR
jgi:ferritin-like metal-binding protein YciE